MGKRISVLAAIACSFVLICALAGCGSSKSSSGIAASSASPSTTSAASSTASSAASSAASASSAAASSASSAASNDLTLGSTISFDGFTIVFGDEVELLDFPNKYSDHADDQVVSVPVTVTNNNDESKGLNMFFITEYGSQGKKLDLVSTYYDDDPRWGNDLRPGATMEGHLYFLYDGDGDYFLEFNNYKQKGDVRIPVQA